MALNGMRILSVTPARGGSKGVPKKNLRHVGGMSLTARVATLASSLPWIDRAVLSTDSEDIQAEGIAHGFAAPFLRPADISHDRAAAIDVWRHAWREMEERDGVRYDASIYIEPTCPLRRPEHCRATVDMLLSGDWDAVWTVSEIDLRYHPLKQLRVAEGELSYYDPASVNIVARQQLDMLYYRNGACYAARRETVMDKASLSGERCGAVVLDEPLVSIDTELDLELAEFYYRRLHPETE